MENYETANKEYFDSVSFGINYTLAVFFLLASFFALGKIGHYVYYFTKFSSAFILEHVLIIFIWMFLIGECIQIFVLTIFSAINLFLCVGVWTGFTCNRLLHGGSANVFLFHCILNYCCAMVELKEISLIFQGNCFHSQLFCRCSKFQPGHSQMGYHYQRSSLHSIYSPCTQLPFHKRIKFFILRWQRWYRK